MAAPPFITLYGTKYSRMDKSKVCGRQPLKKSAYVDHITSNFLKAVFHKFCLVRS